MSRSTRPGRRYLRSLEAAARVVRLFSMGATLLALLVGLATAPKPPTAHAVAGAILIGILFHVYADVSNDVMDLPIDRTDPRQARAPLVRGSVSPQYALLSALLTLPLMLSTCLLAGKHQAVGPLVVASVLIGVYNIAGTRIPVPFAANVIEGLGGGALVFTGAGLGGGWTTATLWAAGVTGTYIITINDMRGAIRDAQSGTRAGARTTGLLLDVRMADRRKVVRLLWARSQGIILQMALGILLYGFLASKGASRPEFSRVVAASSSFVLYLVSMVMLFEPLRRRTDLRAARVARTWHLFLVPAPLLAAAIWRVPGLIGAVMVISFVVPPLLFGWAAGGLDWGIPSSSAVRGVMTPDVSRRQIQALWAMTRPGTPAAAAVLVAIGSVLGGGLRPDVLPAMVATALAVAAANVYNDRCDLVADEINRPDRPIPAGIISANAADRFVFAATVGVVAVSSTIDGQAAVAAGLLVIAGLVYSLRMARFALLGPITVGVLFAAPLDYGGWAASVGIRVEHWIATALVILFVFARETLKSVPDRLGDIAAGYHTIATQFGESAALSLFRCAAAAFCLGSLAATLVAGNLAYLLAAILCAVIPTLHTIRLVKGSPTHIAVNAAISFSGCVFALGIVPLLLM
jgi:4-hydroxybenzoate polyprenyltransferase